ncbi:MAG: hypothetical protein JWQ42_1771 [Edaphobacter sp.]|nr:hypothetical protein [Edaphobacter sp.]
MIFFDTRISRVNKLSQRHGIFTGTRISEMERSWTALSSPPSTNISRQDVTARRNAEGGALQCCSLSKGTSQGSLPSVSCILERCMKRSVSTIGCSFLTLILVCLPPQSLAQPVALTPPQLDQLVARIALFPDPLLANIHCFDILDRDPSSRGLGRGSIPSCSQLPTSTCTPT